MSFLSLRASAAPLRILVLSASLGCSHAALAQGAGAHAHSGSSAPRAAHPHHLEHMAPAIDAAAGVPPVIYRSPLAGYRRIADVPLADWRGANDEVGRIGGWREYLREVDEARKAESAGGSTAPASKPAAAPAPAHRH